MKLTRHYPGNKHAHVGAQRASPEQTQGAVGFSGGETKAQTTSLYLTLAFCGFYVINVYVNKRYYTKISL